MHPRNWRLSPEGVLTFIQPQKLFKIPPSAFVDNEDIISVCVPASVQAMGLECFAGCTSLSSFTFEPGSQLCQIGARAFEGCSSLKSLCLPPLLQVIGTQFLSGSSIEHLTFEPGSKVKQMPQKAFANFDTLKSIFIPASVVEIDYPVFPMPDICDITVDKHNKHFRVFGKFLVDFDGRSVLRYFGTDKDVIIPSVIEALDLQSFKCRRSIVTISFEAGSKLREIRGGVFSSCSSLRSIRIPSSFEVLGTGCFSDCSSLESVTFDPGPKLIFCGGKVFCGCTSLRTICLPGSITNLIDDFFSGCHSLSTLTFESPSSLRSFSSAVLAESAVTSFDLPDSVKYLSLEVPLDHCHLTGFVVNIGPNSQVKNLTPSPKHHLPHAPLFMSLFMELDSRRKTQISEDHPRARVFVRIDERPLRRFRSRLESSR
jgi:hypothetical protein